MSVFKQTSCSRYVPRATVLVVEDEALIRFALADYLRDSGLNVCEARNADEAVEMLSDPSGEIDVVFSDINMPGGMDGLDLASWTKENKPDVPVILTSADRRLADDANLRWPCVNKPYDLKKVVKLIEGAAESRDRDGD